MYPAHGDCLVTARLIYQKFTLLPEFSEAIISNEKLLSRKREQRLGGHQTSLVLIGELVARSVVFSCKSGALSESLNVCKHKDDSCSLS